MEVKLRELTLPDVLKARDACGIDARCQGEFRRLCDNESADLDEIEKKIAMLRSLKRTEDETASSESTMHSANSTIRESYTSIDDVSVLTSDFENDLDAMQELSSSLSRLSARKPSLLTDTAAGIMQREEDSGFTDSALRYLASEKADNLDTIRSFDMLHIEELAAIAEMLQAVETRADADFKKAHDRWKSQLVFNNEQLLFNKEQRRINKEQGLENEKNTVLWAEQKLVNETVGALKKRADKEDEKALEERTNRK